MRIGLIFQKNIGPMETHTHDAGALQSRAEHGTVGKPRHRKFKRWMKGEPDESLFAGDGIVRNYQVIDGKLLFLCYGRAITVRQRPLNVIVFLSMCAVAGLYLGFM